MRKNNGDGTGWGDRVHITIPKDFSNYGNEMGVFEDRKGFLMSLLRIIDLPSLRLMVGDVTQCDCFLVPFTNPR